MADRQNYYAESLTESNTTETTYQDKLSLVFTPDANSKYLIIASWLLQEWGMLYQAKAQLYRSSGTPKVFNEQIYQPKDLSDYISGGCVGIDEFGDSPSEQTYKIQFQTSDENYVAYIKETRIIAIKLVDNDQYAQSEARETTTSTSWQNKTTLTFTPPSQGDYLIIATASLDESSYSYDFLAQLLVNSTPYSVTNIKPVKSDNRYSWGVMVRVNLPATEQTIKIQYCSENAAATAGIANARIVAIRLDELANNYYAEQNSRDTTTQTTYQDKTTLADTPQAQSHLIIASAGIDGASTGYSSYAHLIENSTEYGGEMLIEPKDETSRHFPFFTFYKKTLSNTETTWKIQYKAQSASYAAGIQDARVIVVELVEAIAVEEKFGTDVGSGVEVSLMAATLARLDSGSGIETLPSFLASLIKVDSGVGVETVPSFLALLTKVDSGLGAETLLSRGLALPDGGSGTDLSSLLAEYLGLDTGSGIDLVTELMKGFLALYASDAGQGTDLSLPLLAILARLDGGTGVDLASLLCEIAGEDTGVALDQVILEAVLAKIDQGQGVDLSLPLLVALAKLDVAQGTELVAGLNRILRDIGTGIDQSILEAALSGLDSGAASDLARLICLLTVLDSGTGIDISTLHSILTGLDSGQGVDLSTLEAILTGLDSGLGSDIAKLVYLITALDSGQGVDVSVLHSILAGIDSGAGTDIVSWLARHLQDAGVALDQSTLQAILTGVDIGLGLDKATLIGRLLKLLLLAKLYQRVAISTKPYYNIKVETKPYYDMEVETKL